MKIFNHFTSFQEVPNHLSLCISVKGCPLNCKGCSWTGFENALNFSTDDLKHLLDRYGKYLSCVCFLGGEWETDLPEFLKVVKAYNLKTCLYTGLLEVDEKIRSQLDYLKTGPYIESLGGLQKKTTNQIFIDVKTGENLNHYFIKE